MCSLLSASVTVCSSDFPPVVARGRRRRIDRQADWQAGRQTGRHVQMDSKVNQAGMQSNVRKPSVNAGHHTDKTDVQTEATRKHCCWADEYANRSLLVSWCFEFSQPPELVS